MGTGGVDRFARRATPAELALSDPRGDAAERRVLAALTRPDRPAWIVKVRRARRGENRSGVDVVVDTDVGRVFLQVKSSVAGAQKWRRDHAWDDRPIGIVIAGPAAGDAVVYGRVLAALILLREQVS